MTEEMRGYLEKAKKSVDAATLLQSKESPDIAISRAYYAMFYVATALLLTKGQRYKSHAALLSAFGREFAKTGEVPVEFHRFLLDAQEHRFMGDYLISPHFTEANAREAIAHAEEFVAMGERLLGSSPSETVGGLQ